MKRFQRIGLVFVLCVFSAASFGCYTLRFEVSGEEAGDVVRDRKSFYLFGTTPEVTVDVREKCPEGVVAVEEETTFGDGAARVFTLGIWVPRTSTYYCRGSAAATEVTP